MRKNWFTIFSVKVTAKAYIIKEDEEKERKKEKGVIWLLPFFAAAPQPV